METNYKYWFLNFCSHLFPQLFFYLLLFKVEGLQYLLFKVEVLQIVFFVRISIVNSIEIIFDVLFLTGFFFNIYTYTLFLMLSFDQAQAHLV